jgi:hypothetical protein
VRRRANPNKENTVSFGFTVAGDRDQTAAQLEAIRDDENQDSLRNAVAGLLAEHVGLSELHSYYQQSGVNFQSIYLIKVSGHSGPQSALSLSVTVETPYIPVTESAQPQADETPASAKADVLAAIDRFEHNLGFTAPELIRDRIGQLREQVHGIFERAETEVEDGDGTEDDNLPDTKDEF